VVGSSPVFDGPATNALAHVIHNIMFLGGDGQDEFGQPLEVRGELYRARPVESYDTICLRGQLASGIRFTVAFSHAARQIRPWHIEVLGSSGVGRLVEEAGGNGDETTLSMARVEEVFGGAYDNFVRFASGEIPRPLTRLKDSCGFVLATNAALLSSKGIHDISPPFSGRFDDSADGGYDIPGMHGLMDGVLHDGLLFSEQAAPWACATETVRLERLHALPFAEMVEAIREKRVSDGNGAGHCESSAGRSSHVSSI
jgi:hypothetical protein